MAPVQYVSDAFTYPGGAVASGVLAYVYFENTRALAPIYHDSSGVRAPNPLRTNEDGVVEFFAEPGDYDLVVQGETFPITLDGSGGPGAASAQILLTFSAGAPGAPGLGKSQVYNDLGRSLQIIAVRLTANSVSGLPLIADVNKNGATIFTDQSHRPQLPVSGAAGSVKVTAIDVPALADGDRLSVDVDQGNFSYMVLQVYAR